MKLHSNMKINGKMYRQGMDVPWYMVYPFFMFHMLMFGGSGFLIAYGSDSDVAFLFMHGGIAITVYLIFYFTIFGVDQEKVSSLQESFNDEQVEGFLGKLASLEGLDDLIDSTSDSSDQSNELIDLISELIINK